MRLRVPALSLRHKRELRHWSIELAVVVVGVLLALLTAEWANGRAEARRLAAAEEAMAAELNDAALYLAARHWAEPCILDQQKRLAVRIREGGKNWSAFLDHTISVEPVATPPVMRGVVHVPRAELTNSAWQSALSSGALDTMDRDRFVRYVDLYRQLDVMQGRFSEELKAAEVLSPLTSDIVMDEQARQEYLRALYRWASATIEISAQEDFYSDLRELGIVDEKWFADQIAMYEGVTGESFPNRRSCLGKFRNPFAEPEDSSRSLPGEPR